MMNVPIQYQNSLGPTCLSSTSRDCRVVDKAATLCRIVAGMMTYMQNWANAALRKARSMGHEAKIVWLHPIEGAWLHTALVRGVWVSHGVQFTVTHTILIGKAGDKSKSA
jgi:hypothetical protein